jgi:hypothetical protein
MQHTSEGSHLSDHPADKPRRPRRSWMKLATTATAATAAAAIVISLSGFTNSSGPGRAAVVHWATCLRENGVPTFPNPDRHGAIDSGTFDPTSAAMTAATRACTALQPQGAITAVPGKP